MTKKVQALMEQFSVLYPDAQTELIFHNPFELLIATLLSAQSTDKAVNAATVRLFTDYPTPFHYLSIEATDLYPYIQTIGLYRTKAKHVVETARILVEQYAGEVPASREKLTQLPGVGRKTANVVLANAFGIPAFAVDTHVFRVSHRLGLAQGKTVEQTEAELCRKFPKSSWSTAHHWLILHGRRVCNAKKPQCGGCAVQDLCVYGRAKRT